MSGRYHHHSNVSSSNAAYVHKPENALRRAQELVGVVGQPLAALQLLHDVLSGRRHRTWAPIYEECMDYYLDLCLQMNKTREAKDGLHQYRNLSQSQAPGSLENVIRTFIQKAETACTLAKEQATLDVTDDDNDLVDDEDEDEEGDEEEGRITSSKNSMMLLSTMSADPAQVQRDSTLLLPKLKFLWESYRAVLDILKSNSKLEHVYHMIAVGALQFCATYKRRTEFRRLCDMLRMHLGNLQKYGNTPSIPGAADTTKTNNKIRGWEGWTMESLELHLRTRFAQLETASTLRLYTEGFRTVEDIYLILQIAQTHAKRLGGMPRAKLLANYYEKVSQLFWISENYLFHAFALYKYHTLCVDYNRALTAPQLQQQASCVLLAALSIPPNHQLASAATSAFQSGARSKLAANATAEDLWKEKTARMSTLLGFHTRHPSRQILMEELLAKKILDKVPAYLQQLHQVLEQTSNPLVMVQKARPLFAQLQEQHPTYLQPLTQVLLLKLLHALARSYHTISLSHLQHLTAGLGVTFTQVEKTIVRAAAISKTMSVRLDHRAQCLRFGPTNSVHMDSNDELRTHLVLLSKQLRNVVQTHLSSSEPQGASDAADKRVQLFAQVKAQLQSEHEAMLARKDYIEKKKEEVERVAQEQQKEAERQALEKQRQARAEEDRRLAKEKLLREKEKLQKIQNEMKLSEIKQYLKAMGKNPDTYSEAQLLQLDTAALAKEHADKAAKKKNNEERKTQAQKKRLDHIVRATRMEELPKIQAKEQQRVEQERQRYQDLVLTEAKRAKEQFQTDGAHQQTLASFSVFQYMSSFEQTIMKHRKHQHHQECAVEDDRAVQEAERLKLKRAKQRKQDAIRKAKEEEARKLKEEAAQREAEERAKREEERRKREEEAQRKETERMAALSSRSNNNTSAEPPRSRNLEDMAKRTAASSTSTGSGGRYVPPSRRGAAGTGGGAGGSRFGSGSNNSSRSSYGDRGGSYGGGRYDRNSRGPPEPRNSRWS